MRLVTELVTIFKRSGNFRQKIAASFVLFTFLPLFFSFFRIEISREGIREKRMAVLLRKVGFDISGLNRGCLRFFLYSRKTARRGSAGRNYSFRLLKLSSQGRKCGKGSPRWSRNRNQSRTSVIPPCGFVSRGRKYDSIFMRKLQSVII